jgi:hypothetical protein
LVVWSFSDQSTFPPLRSSLVPKLPSIKSRAEARLTI